MSYSFGLKQKGYNNNISGNGNSLAQNYKYNGKELNEELGLDWYDFGARNYDPALGRWMNIDPLADKYQNFSPFHFAGNNPILYTDPDGKRIIIGDNTRDAVKKLAMVAATRRGRTVVDYLIKKNKNIYLDRVFLSGSNSYDHDGALGRERTVYYASSVWMPSWFRGGGATNSEYYFGHELEHAYRVNRGESREFRTRERSAVSFGNYMRAAFGEDDMRTYYQGAGSFSDNPKDYNPENEKISNFEQIADLSSGTTTSLAFSYTTSINDEEENTHYIIGTATGNGNFSYVTFNSKEEYEERLAYIEQYKKENPDEE